MGGTGTRMVYGTRRGMSGAKLETTLKKPLSDYSRNDVWHEGERLAADYLVRNGLEILDRNWRCKAGEADIIALEDDVVVLVEVKTRVGAASDGNYPELAVDYAKLARYQRLLKYFIMEHPDVHSVRFDVIAVNLVSDGKASLRRIVNAATWDD